MLQDRLSNAQTSNTIYLAILDVEGVGSAGEAASPRQSLDQQDDWQFGRERPQYATVPR